MKPFLSLGLLLFICCISCHKHKEKFDYYLPEIGDLKCIQLSDGKLELSAEVTKQGDGPLQYLVFCVDTTANVTAQKGMQYFTEEIIGNRFSIILDEVDGNKTYYCKAYAASEIGYAQTGTIMLKKPVAAGVNCTPALNSYAVSAKPVDPFQYVSIHDNSYSGHGGNGVLEVFFGRKVTTGVYTIDGLAFNSTELKGHKASVHISLPPFDEYYLTKGKVYVTQNSGDSIDVVICEGEFVDHKYDKRTLVARFSCER